MFRHLSDRALLTRETNTRDPSLPGTQQPPPPAPAPASAPSPLARQVARTVGRTNPALVGLQNMRSRLTPSQAAIVTTIERFYEDNATPKRNLDLDFIAREEFWINLTDEHERTLERRASFLLNSDSMYTMDALICNIVPDAGPNGHSVTTIAVNAVACSVKSQTEHVKEVALQEAQRGERICPMTLQQLSFQNMLYRNEHLLKQAVQACRMPVAQRERALNPLLVELAASYFEHSRDAPGAPKSVPQKVIVSMHDSGQSDFDINPSGETTARLVIDSNGIDDLCNAPLQAANTCEDYRTIFRAHLLEGFQEHSPEKKRAALYLQLLWVELGAVHEMLGLHSLDKPNHGAEAQRAAARTHEEISYPGSHSFGDQISAENGMEAQRHVVTQAMEALPTIDAAFQQRFGTSMITDSRIHAWTQSPAYSVDLRMLRQPGSRLLLQAIPITGSAMLNIPIFRTLT